MEAGATGAIPSVIAPAMTPAKTRHKNPTPRLESGIQRIVSLLYLFGTTGA
jgi:hypothetical protein